MKKIVENIFSVILLSVAMLLPVQTGHAAVSTHVDWSVEAEMTSGREGIVRWTANIESGWHIYGLTMPKLENTVTPPPTSFTVDSFPGLVLKGDIVPDRPAAMKVDEVMNLKVGQWDGKVTFIQHFAISEGVSGVDIRGVVRYQACSDKACTPPTKYSFDVKVGSPVITETVADAAPVVAPASRPVEQKVSNAYDSAQWWAPVEVSDSGAPAPSSETSAWWSLLLWGFLGGLAALLTPCVWPMIPMTMSFFLKKTSSRRKSMADAFTYGLSIIVIYLALGIAITLIFGAGKLNELATSALFNVIFFLILVVFAISFFGAFNITLPSKWSNKIDSRAENTTGLISIFFMAFTLVLVSFSCTGPIIGTLLVEAAAQNNILGPALGMGGFALGLALPFSVFALFPSLMKEMPK